MIGLSEWVWHRDCASVIRTLAFAPNMSSFSDNDAPASRSSNDLSTSSFPLSRALIPTGRSPESVNRLHEAENATTTNQKRHHLTLPHSISTSAKQCQFLSLYQEVKEKNLDTSPIKLIFGLLEQMTRFTLSATSHDRMIGLRHFQAPWSEFSRRAAIATTSNEPSSRDLGIGRLIIQRATVVESKVPSYFG